MRYLRADGTTSSTTSYPKGDGVMGVTTDYDRNGDVVSVFACEGCGHKSTPCPCHYGVDDITVG